MRFFHRCRTFWQKKGGFGIIEAAITLPLFLMITFGVIEFGSMYLQRYGVRDVSDAVKDYLQADPGADTTEMTTFLNALGVGLKGTGEGGENRIITKIRIASNKTIYTTAQFDALCASSAAATFPIPNPWANDPDPEQRENQYFIHVCYPYTYKAITPLPGLTAGVIPTTKVLNGKAVAIINATTGGGNPTFPEKICPTGQALTAFTQGQFVCGLVGGGQKTCTQLFTGHTFADGSRLVGTGYYEPGYYHNGGKPPGRSYTIAMTQDQGPRLRDYTWKEANAYCENLSAHGHTDWVLPSVTGVAGVTQVAEANHTRRRTKVPYPDYDAWAADIYPPISGSAPSHHYSLYYQVDDYGDIRYTPGSAADTSKKEVWCVREIELLCDGTIKP